MFEKSQGRAQPELATLLSLRSLTLLVYRRAQKWGKTLTIPARFEQVDKRFAFMQWMIGLDFTVTLVIIAVARYLN